MGRGSQSQAEFKGNFGEEEGYISPRDRKKRKRKKDDPDRF